MKKGKGTPKVGIFYLVGSEIMFDAVEQEAAEIVNGTCTHGDHYGYFYGTLIREKPQYAWDEYDYPPRGRVVYSMKRKKFWVYCSPRIGGSKLKEVIRLFGLKNKTWLLKRDGHYR